MAAKTMGGAKRGLASEDGAGLARAWPRVLLAEGRGERLARWWRSAQAREVEAGRPGLARSPADPRLLSVLGDAWRARRLERGLEGAQAALAAEEAGLRAAVATRPVARGTRISRLLVVSGDGSPRFYREVEKLRTAHASRLEVLMLDCDEVVLGEAVFGRGRRARAVLLDHKEAVARLLVELDELLRPERLSPESKVTD
jgi:hypothetical protein